MKYQSNGPFKKGIGNKDKNLSFNSFWITIALTLIAITQIPLAIESTLNIFNPSNCIEKIKA